jgi:hypothetical protein
MKSSIYSLLNLTLRGLFFNPLVDHIQTRPRSDFAYQKSIIELLSSDKNKTVRHRI